MQQVSEAAPTTDKKLLIGTKQKQNTHTKLEVFNAEHSTYIFPRSVPIMCLPLPLCCDSAAGPV